MSYEVSWPDGPASFDRGTSLLVTGETNRAEQRLYDAVAPTDGERAIVITMNAGAEAVVSALRDRGADGDQVAVIDCTGQSAGGAVASTTVRELHSPGDLTGISLEFAKLNDEIDEETAGIRVGFASVSTALMYDELRTVFRFLHVFTARIRSGEMFGVFALDPSMHEPQAHNTIRAVFDCEATIGDGDTEGDGVLTLQGSGFQR